MQANTSSTTAGLPLKEKMASAISKKLLSDESIMN